MAVWDVAAWVCFCMPRPMKRPPEYERFHPIRGKLAELEQRAALRMLDRLMDTLPDDLPEEEIFRRFEAYKAKHPASKAGRGSKSPASSVSRRALGRKEKASG